MKCKVPEEEAIEDKRRQMKEELEARARGAASMASAGVKRPRGETKMEAEIRRLAEEGRRRRQILEERRKAEAGNVSIPVEPASAAETSAPERPQTAAEEA